MSGSHYLVVSDLHLADIEHHSDGWRRYKGSHVTFDEAFDARVERFVSESPEGARLTLVLNGDIFDFDVVVEVPSDPPWPTSWRERRFGLAPTAAKSRWKLGRMIADHGVFVATLARFAARGHRVVYVLGNHDRELHFSEVQAVLRDAIVASAAAEGLALDGEACIEFEPWFLYVPGEVYIEHGNQYDPLTSFRHVLNPVVEGRGGEPRIAHPMGELCGRYLINRMGFFNPHGSDFLLSLFGYLAHWLRHYAFSKRSLALAWAWGSLLVLLDMLNNEKQQRLGHAAARHRESLEAYARRVGLPVETLVEHARRSVPRTADRFFWAVHELWFDRVAIALLMTGATIALALVPIPLWIKLMVPLSTFPLLYLGYQTLVRATSVPGEREMPAQAHALAAELDCRVVSFGHTHGAVMIPLSRGVSFVNTGTWAPKWEDAAGERLAPGGWTYLIARFSGEEAELHLDSWAPARALGGRGPTGSRSQ